jgi:hypothetical protein
VDDLVQFGTANIRAVQSIEDTIVEGALAKELGCVNGTRWLRISSLRLQDNANSAPIGWTDVYLGANADSSRQRLKAAYPAGSISSACGIPTLNGAGSSKSLASIRTRGQALDP